MPFKSAEGFAQNALWLGLVVDNRQLLGALENGWFVPRRSARGVILGIGSYALDDGWELPQGSRFPVRVRFDPAVLPNLQVAVFRNGEWSPTDGTELRSSDQALYWPGVLPTFAIEALSVATEEERRRLIGLTRVTSNLELPDVPFRVDANSQPFFESAEQPPDLATSLVLPDDEDAIRGSLSMAVWAVPRIDSWMNVLTAALDPGRGQLAEFATAVEAAWWRCPPWASPSLRPVPTSSQERLWLAAIQVFRSLTPGTRVGALDLADEIAGTASEWGISTDSSAIGTWRTATRGVLRGVSPVTLERWRACPVGIALQLVLARPEPIRFKGWFKDRPDLPPAIGWSAAALCGLLHGYRRLDREFRGGPVQKEALSIRALHLSGREGEAAIWPTVRGAKPSWRKDCDRYTLYWGERDYACKRENVRGRWIAADFRDPTVTQAAKDIARRFSWRCSSMEVDLTDQAIPLDGNGTVELVDSSMKLVAQGQIRMRLPNGVEVEEVLDSERFRELVAVESGPLPEPPPSYDPSQQRESSEIPGGVAESWSGPGRLRAELARRCGLPVFSD